MPSAVAPSKITAFAASIVTVSTCVVVPATVRFGTSNVPVLGLYRNAPVSSNSAFDSSWNTTGKFVFDVLSVTVTVLDKVDSAIAILAVPSNEVPPIVLAVASAVAVAASPTAIFAVPSKEVPPMVLAVASAVAVAAFPVAEPAEPLTLPVTLPVNVPVTVRLSAIVTSEVV